MAALRRWSCSYRASRPTTAIAPLRLLRALVLRADATGEAPPRSPLPLPAGHPRGVALFLPVPRRQHPDADAESPVVALHVLVFPPSAAADDAVLQPPASSAAQPSPSPQLLRALRAAAAAGRCVVLLPPTGGAAETWAWSGTVSALIDAGYWVRAFAWRAHPARLLTR